MNSQQLNILADAVQHNCHISDARHGADYSLCIYLMKMREYYRWEQRLPYGAMLEKDAVGAWLQARERLWEDLEDAALVPLSIDGQAFDPYDADAINQVLTPQGLVYSSGLGNRAKPHFFLAELEQREHTGGYEVFVAASEYARDLTAPPAMTRGSSIFSAARVAEPHALGKARRLALEASGQCPWSRLRLLRLRRRSRRLARGHD
jgi:hypothetical protein